MRARAAAVTMVVVLLGLTACGIPVDEQPRVVQPPPGPFQALASPAPVGSQSGAVVETLYFTRGDRIIPVVRRLDAEPSVEETVGDLMAGPTEAEQTDRIGSALPGTALIDGVRVEAGVATVSLGASLEGTRNDEILAYGQMVCTLDARSDVNGVVFVHDGERSAVPTGDGSLTKATLTTADYEELFAPR